MVPPFFILIMKYRLLFVTSLLLSSLSLWSASGDPLVAKTIENVEMKFKIASEEDKTCSVDRDAIDKYTSGVITIPEYVQGYKTVSIAQKAFEDCVNITSVIIPDGVQVINEKAFRGCTSLVSINVPSGVQSLSNMVFKDCKKLTSVSLSEGLLSIGSWAFQNCESLSEIHIPSTVTQIGHYGSNPFSGCTGLKAVHIKDIAAWCRIEFGNYDQNPLSIAHHLYLNNEEVRTVTFPADLEINGKKSTQGYTFYGCEGLESVNIPEGVVELGQWLFVGCANLKTVNLPSTLSVIPYSAFQNCTSLETIDLPSTLSKLNNNAFDGCVSLKNIQLPKGLTAISDYLFNGCRSLKEISIPESVESIGNGAFQDCTSLASIKIPQKVTSIGESAFHGCTALTEIDIPSDVQSIGKFAFTPLRSAMNLKVVRSYIREPFNIPYATFTYTETLYVPYGTKSKYANTDYWSRFKNIVEMDEITGIKNVDTTSLSDSKQKYYDINGHLNNGLRKGINIIHKDNGESIKIFIK